MSKTFKATPPDEPLLAAILNDLWRQLETAVNDPQHAWHWPVLATVTQRPGQAGDLFEPDARTVVLRAANQSQNWLEAHSDFQAAKCEQLSHQPIAMLTSYNPATRIQLRIRGTVRQHHENCVAEQAWQTLSASSRHQYAGFDRFMVMRLQADSIDWLSLASEPHQRARFIAARSGHQAHAKFLAP